MSEGNEEQASEMEHQEATAAASVVMAVGSSTRHSNKRKSTESNHHHERGPDNSGPALSCFESAENRPPPSTHTAKPKRLSFQPVVVPTVVKAEGTDEENLPQKENESEDLSDQERRSKGLSDFVMYEACTLLPDLKERVGELIQVVIDSEYLINSNQAFCERRLWGNDVYTDDSDIVCIAVHQGQLTLTDSPSSYHALSVFVRVMPKQKIYLPSSRNGLKSRHWDDYDGLSLKLEGLVELKENEFFCSDASRIVQVPLPLPPLQTIKGHSSHHTNDCRIVFNLSSEPSFWYNLYMVADRNPEAESWTSVRLKEETLYLETEKERYELAFESDSGTTATYRWSRVLDPVQTSHSVLATVGVPLPRSHTELIFPTFTWDEISFGVKSVRVLGQQYSILRCLFVQNGTIKNEQ